MIGIALLAYSYKLNRSPNHLLASLQSKTLLHQSSQYIEKTTPSKIKSLVQELRYMKSDERLQLLTDILNNNDALITLYNENNIDSSYIKILLCACIQTNSLTITKSYIEQFNALNVLNDELLYMGIHYACQAYNSDIAYYLHEYSIQYTEFKIDSYLLNKLIQLLIITNKLNIACDLLENCLKQEYGSDTKAELYTYTLLLDAVSHIHTTPTSTPTTTTTFTTSTTNNKAITTRALKIIEKSGKMKISEDTYISSLSIFCYNYDYISAIDILNQYQKSYNIIQIKAYSLVLTAFIYSIDNAYDTNDSTPTTTITSTTTTRTTSTNNNNNNNNNNNKSYELYPDIDRIISTLIRSSLDTSETIASLILQYFCIRYDIVRADLYLKRLQANGILPAITALLAYSQLIDLKGDLRRSASFSAYLNLHGYKRFFDKNSRTGRGGRDAVSGSGGGGQKQAAILGPDNIR